MEGKNPYFLWKTEPMHGSLTAPLGAEYATFAANLDPATAGHFFRRGVGIGTVGDPCLDSVTISNVRSLAFADLTEIATAAAASRYEVDPVE